jgi:two-component system, NtrC family, sensor kinase
LRNILLATIKNFFLPKTLFGRLIVLPSSAVIVSFLLIFALFGYNQYFNAKADMRHDSKVVIKELSASVDKYLLLQDYAEIESIMRRFSLIETVKSISLVNSEYRALIEISKDENKDLLVVLNPNKKYEIINSHNSLFVNEDPRLYAIYDVVGGETKPSWIRVEIDKEFAYSKIMDFLLYGSFIALFFMILLSIVIFQIIRKPLEDIKLLTIFSSNLDKNIGKVIVSKSEISEIRSLTNSLNQLSKKLLKNQNVMNHQHRELKEFNEELTSRVEEEVGKNREKDIMILNSARLVALAEMIGNIAHQWRQPLNAIGVMIQSIQVSYELEDLQQEEFDEFVKDSMAQVNYLSKTIDDFRDMTKDDVIDEEFDVSELISKTFALMEPSLKHSSIAARLDLEKNITATHSNASALSQAFINIFNNAKDVLKNQNKNDKLITIRLKRNKNKAQIAICDNGGGVPEDIIEKIFDPYFTTKHQSNGTGLGLYISKNIVNNDLGGALYAKNADNGACFTIEFDL